MNEMYLAFPDREAEGKHVFVNIKHITHVETYISGIASDDKETASINFIGGNHLLVDMPAQAVVENIMAIVERTSQQQTSKIIQGAF